MFEKFYLGKKSKHFKMRFLPLSLLLISIQGAIGLYSLYCYKVKYFIFLYRQVKKYEQSDWLRGTI